LIGRVWFVAVFMIVALAADGQDIRPVMTPVLVDANGNLIGPLVAAHGMHGGTGLVSVEIEGKTALLTFRRDIGIDEIRWWSDMFFTGAGCSGIPYIQDTSVAERLAIVSTDGTLYVSDEKWDGAVQLRSRIVNGACVESGGGGGMRMRPAGVNMLTAFPPPYRITSYGGRSRVVAH
jgi:hypothetical protein